MPIYEYVCDSCRKRTEVIQAMNAPRLKVCPHCGGKLTKVFSAPAIQFKGSGFYLTDYARGSGAGDAGGGGKPDSGEKSEKSEKSEKAEKSEKSAESSEKSAKSEKSEKPAKAEKSEKSDKSEKKKDRKAD